jgi:hypothetical protein
MEVAHGIAISTEREFVVIHMEDISPINITPAKITYSHH